MRSIRLLAPGKLEMRDIPDRISATETTVQVDVSACGICGSDLALYNGRRDLSREHYFGHEFSGIITDAGKGANGLRSGMRVASELVKGCGRCWFCRNGLQNYCKSLNDALFPGGFTEKTLVTNTEAYGFLSPIPSVLDDITATLMEPANCAFHVAKRAEIKPGDSVLIFGLGAIGLIASQILKSLGAGKIVGADRSELRLAQVRKSGLLDVVNTNDADWLEQIKEMTAREGVDVVVEATGAPAVLQDAMSAARTGGRIVVPSVYFNSIDGFKPLPIMRKELTIIGSKGPAPLLKSDGTSAVVDKVIELKSALEKMITVYEYKDALQAFEDARNGSAIKAVIKF
ncbi:L-threonine dehydrogenase [Mitsuokella sp. AF33-22]|uniref:zinc-dependent alcohol dehydrogenase n=1 Tax=Mitsuokella sp. AF33-22 TaxID=2292047 RepID=UPI000E4BDF53|nr:zinc-binding dehydrogenase [Mitsuokella sp. AF33-22]RHM53581.1 L-threonine dehydrogenase [Mitsuokella sp. AF33-22]